MAPPDTTGSGFEPDVCALCGEPWAAHIELAQRRLNAEQTATEHDVILMDCILLLRLRAADG